MFRFQDLQSLEHIETEISGENDEMNEDDMASNAQGITEEIASEEYSMPATRPTTPQLTQSNVSSTASISGPRSTKRQTEPRKLKFTKKTRRDERIRNLEVHS